MTDFVAVFYPISNISNEVRFKEIGSVANHKYINTRWCDSKRDNVIVLLPKNYFPLWLSTSVDITSLEYIIQGCLKKFKFRNNNRSFGQLRLNTEKDNRLFKK